MGSVVIGQRFGHLTVLDDSASVQRRSGKYLTWIKAAVCKCDCGRKITRAQQQLLSTSGPETSCGCRRGWQRVKGTVAEDGRECSKCGTWKPWSEYNRNPSKRMGHSSECRVCSREYMLANWDHLSWYFPSTYGISREEYEWLSEQQGHKCALCGEEEVARRRRDPRTGTERVSDRLGVDHDHSCIHHSVRKGCKECIRGLLCDCCNRLLGFADNRPAVAVRFSDYLERRPFKGGG